MRITLTVIVLLGIAQFALAAPAPSKSELAGKIKENIKIN